MVRGEEKCRYQRMAKPVSGDFWTFWDDVLSSGVKASVSRTDV